MDFCLWPKILRHVDERKLGVNFLFYKAETIGCLLPVLKLVEENIPFSHNTALHVQLKLCHSVEVEFFA